ncbi:MAG: hypothetical protein K8H84_09105 [Sulfuricella denitrificans]|nr:hypothetical protein [Sulfuricella denitrificans]
MDGDMNGVTRNTRPLRQLGTKWLPFLFFCVLPFDFSFAVDMLPDPTRPPAEAGMMGDVAAVASGPVLQSVVIRPGLRSAVISGQLLVVGERFGDAKLIQVSEGEAILVGPEGRQVLKLFPDVDKQFAQPPQAETLKRGKNKPKRNSKQKAS